jgi:chemosensory pili system protein ChpA (sensor histidine kinase/response regulator)
MQLDERIDFSRLAWVKSELGQLLAAARDALERFSEDAGDKGSIQDCASRLHQTLGTLRMVELHGAAELACEMERLARVLLEDDPAGRDDALSALMRALVQLPDYLDLVDSGHKDIPIVLLPLINELRDARGAEPADPCVLFHPVIDRPLPPEAAGARAAYPFADLRQRTGSICPRFEELLLAWTQDQQPDFASMREGMEALQATCYSEPARRLWWIAGGVLEALEQGRLDPGAASLRQQFGQLDQVIRNMQDQGEDVCNDDDARELTRTLLFAVTQAQSGAGRSDNIIATFALDQMALSAAELEHAQAAVSGRNRAVLDTVANAVREDLLRVKEGLDIFLRQEERDPGRLDAQAETLKRIGGTLDMVGLHASARMIVEQREVLAGIAAGQRDATPGVVLDVASALLYVDASLDAHIENLGATRIEGASPLPASEARDILRALMREATTNIGRVKVALTGFIESSWSHERLAVVPKMLGEVSGALRILNLERPASLVDGIDRYIGNELLARRRVPTVDDMDALADAMAGIEYYLEVGRDATASHGGVLDRAQSSLHALGYWPVPEALTVAADPIDPVLEPAAEIPPVAAPGAVPAVDPAPQAETAIPPGAGPGKWVEVEVEQEVLVPVGEDELVDSAFQETAGIDEEIREVFVEEVAEEIANINVNLPVWKSNPDDRDALGNVRRSFHTLKGSGRLVGATVLSEFSWKIENLLNRLLDETIVPDGNVQEVIDAAVATLPKLQAGLLGKAVSLDLPLDAIMHTADKLAAGKPARIADFLRDCRKIVRTVRRWVGQSETVPGPDAPEWIAPEHVPTSADPSLSSALPVVDAILLQVLDTEVGQHLAILRAYLARNGGHDVAVDDEVVRAVHTLHGSIAMVGIEPLAGMLAPMEVWMRRVRGADAALDQVGCDALRDAVAMTEQVTAQLHAEVPEVPDTAALTRRIEALRDRWPEHGSPDAALPLADAPIDPEPVSEEVAACPVTGQSETDPVAGEQTARDLGAPEPAAAARRTAEQAEAERVAAEQVERERLAAEQAAAERRAAEQAEAERVAAEKAERLARARQQAAREIAAAALPPFPDDPQPDGPLELEALVPELTGLFTEEGNELLDASDNLLATLRSAPDDLDCVRALQRNLHTFKGSARVTGVAAAGDLAHAMETLLEAIGDRKRAAEPVEVDSLERGFDRLHDLVQRVEQGQAIATPEHAIERFGALVAGRPVPAREVARAQWPPPAPPPRPAPVLPVGADAPAPAEVIRVHSDLLDSLMNAAGETSIYHARLGQQISNFRFNLVELDQTVARLRQQLRKLEIETEAQILSRYQRENQAGENVLFDPLELDRFSNLQQYSRTLAESVADVASIQDILDDQALQFETLLLHQSRANSDLQEGLMHTRMVPFESLVPNLRRTLRGAADELGKQAQLRVIGAEGDMDRSVLERMKAPLEHMLRNALTHGIEAPADRVAIGKPMAGTITVQVSRQGTEVLVRVSDDGAGFDREAIRRKAIERGLLQANTTIADQQLFEFVLQTGFTTAGTVSQLSGRGVGMDVVANEVRQLGGSLAIESEPGRGTAFNIRLPFTLAVTQAITVRVDDTAFAVPMTSVQAVTRMRSDAMAERVARGEMTVSYADENYVLYDLAELLGLGDFRTPEGGTDRLPLLMVSVGDVRAAIRVDMLVGSREIFVKPVSPQISNIPGMFGATIMGDGSVLLILDLAPLVRHFVANRMAATGSGDQPAAPKRGVRQPALVMVVDDSITMRKATTRILERGQMEVVTAKDGVDALERLQERVPDVLLLDLEMPRMDGYELATRLKNDERFRRVPIVIITSRTSEKHRQRAFEIGVDRYLGKPYAEADLLRSIAEVLESDDGR